MKKLFLYIFLLSILSACAPIRAKSTTEYYKGKCKRIEYGELMIMLRKEGNSFDYIYQDIYVGEDISGKWEIKKDTLFLDSEIFKRETISMDEFGKLFDENPYRTDFPPTDTYKYTEYEGPDAYLIKKRKLYRLNKEGKRDGCPLKKMKIEYIYYEKKLLGIYPE